MEGEGEILGFFGFHMFTPKCHPGTERLSAEAELKEDISPVFPYVNARLRAFYNPEFPFVRFRWKEHVVTLHPHKIMVSNLENPEQAADVLKELRLFINETWQKRNEVQPSYEVRTPPPVPEIFKRLPKTNCGQCGFPSCMAFAAALSSGDAQLEGCPPLYAEQRYERLRMELEQLLR